MNMQVRRNEKAQRYELVEDDNVIGIAEYHPDGDTLVFPHTEITPRLRGNGMGDRLVRGALDDVRRRGAKVRAACWFVREFIDDNPDYADLVAS
jgi:predicted GNAT family acetyltransferase